MAFVEQRPSCHRGLMMALGALVQTVGQNIRMMVTAFGANEA